MRKPTLEPVPSDVPLGVGPAFTRTANRMVLFVAGFAIVAFAAGSEWLLRGQAVRTLAIRAELFAAALSLRGDADLAESVTHLQAHTDRLIAVAPFDEQGAIRRVFPNRPNYRAIADRAMENIGTAFSCRASDGGPEIEAIGLLTSLDAKSPGSSTRILLVTRWTPYRIAWIKAVVLVAFGVGSIAFLRLWSLNRWFDRRVVRPLRDMASLGSDPGVALSRLPTIEHGVWEETAQIAQQIESLLRKSADAESRAQRVEQDTRRQLLHRERGFDLKLRRAKDEASIDPLTRMRNRVFLEGELESIFQQSRERNEPLSVVMIDLDNFKKYNDSNGHQVGDTLLRFVGSLLRGGIRPTDHAVRYGGDEFLLLLPETDGAGAAAIVDRLIKLFSQYALQAGASCNVSMSAGVACSTDPDCESGHALVSFADAALYAAKAAGKNTVYRHRPDSNTAEVQQTVATGR